MCINNNNNENNDKWCNNVKMIILIMKINK